MSEDKQAVVRLPREVQWAMGWLMICCGLFVFNAFVALFGLHVMSISFPVFVVLALAVLYWSGKIDGRAIAKRELVVIGVVFVITTILLGYVVSMIWEYSYWGRGFYTDAILALTDGWNPIYDGAKHVSSLVYHSAKAVWYMDASLYAFLGHYEMAKLHTVLFAIPTFILTRHCFDRFLGGRWRVATLASVILLLNPVAISQMFTYYDDAVLAFAIVCFLMLGYLTLNEGYLHSDLLMTMAFLWVFMLNMQMGGMRAALVLGLAFLGFAAMLYMKQAVKWLAIRAAVVVVIGFVIIGFNPFIQNWVDTGNPFCLAFGEHAVNLTTAYMPWVLEGKTQLGQFFTSMMSTPNTSTLDWNILLQQLTALVNSAYAAADVRLRGFGFFGGFLLVAALVLFYMAIFLPSRQDVDEDGVYFDDDGENRKMTNYIGARTALFWMSVPILLIVVLSPTPWWARSVAVFWTMIPLTVVALAMRHGNGKSATAKLLLTVAFLNCGLMAFSMVSAATSYTVDMRGHWERMNTVQLPTMEDARVHNEYIRNFKSWNKLKAKGEAEREKRAIWTKVEGIIK